MVVLPITPFLIILRWQVSSFFGILEMEATSTEVNPTHLYTDTGTYTIHLLVIDNGTCNISDSTTQTIQVHGSPKAAFITTPQPADYNVQPYFHNNSTGATHYTWFFGDGDSTDKQSADTVIHHVSVNRFIIMPAW